MFGRHSAADVARPTVSRRDAGEDARLIESVARGDLRAFEDLYRAYHPRLARFIRTIVRSAPLVEEVLDDTMMVVWRHPDRYNGKSKLSTWIFAIAYRKALKALKRHEEPIEDKHAENRESAEAGPELEVGRRQTQQALIRAVNELSRDHRAVVDLTYFHGIGYREIAEIMACPIDTVKTRMYHARRHLKTKLTGQLADWL
jgi:RNA polymerase sigma-70 factor (ECF subfamily)